MNASSISASVSMRALQQKLDVLSNNIANIDTVGYKKKDIAFSDVLNTMINQPEGFEHRSRYTPIGVPNGFGMKVSNIFTSWTQGPIKTTEQPFDLAIEGNGLFQVSNPNTADTTPLWTRDGSFTTTLVEGDADNVYLANGSGYLLLGTGDQPISIPKDATVKISDTGVVTAFIVGENGESTPTNIGQIKMARVNKPEGLFEVGNNIYTVTGGVNNANGEIVEVVDLTVDNNYGIAIRQGALEQSNVELSKEMSDLISLQRAFQLSSKALVSADSMASMANNLGG